MKKEVKDIRYNVRMTQQTFDIVDSFEGNSFTSKFETLVEHAFIEKKRIDDEILESQMNPNCKMKLATSGKKFSH